MSERKEKNPKEEAEEVKEILNAVSTQVPALIKSLLASVFSEEAGRSRGKAAAAYYKELKDSSMPENVAVKMTEDYMKTFTSLGSMLQNIGGSGKHGQKLSEKSEQALGKEIGRRIHEKLKEKPRARDEEEDEEARE